MRKDNRAARALVNSARRMAEQENISMDLAMVRTLRKYPRTAELWEKSNRKQDNIWSRLNGN